MVDGGGLTYLYCLFKFFVLHKFNPLSPLCLNCFVVLFYKFFYGFILAVFLNPFIRTRLFRRGNPRLTANELYNMATRVFKRVYQHEPHALFHSAFFDYFEENNEYAPERMNLKGFEQHHKIEVWRMSSFPSEPSLILDNFVQ